MQALPVEPSSCIARLIQQHLGSNCSQGALQDTRTPALTAEEPCLQFCNTCDKRTPARPQQKSGMVVGPTPVQI